MPSDWLSCAGSETTTQTTTTTQTQDNAPANTNGGGQNWTSMIILFAIMIVFVVIMIVPQKRREKKMRQMLDAIKPGDEIRTIGGIYGKVDKVKEDLVTITTGPNDDKLVFAKGAIEFVINPEEQKKLEELDKDDDEGEEKPKKKSIFSRKNK